MATPALEILLAELTAADRRALNTKHGLLLSWEAVTPTALAARARARGVAKALRAECKALLAKGGAS